VLRFDFAARGGLVPVSVYWHDSARTENETILPQSDNLADKGRPRAGRAGSGGARTARRPRGGPRTGAGGPGVPVFGPGNTTPPERGILTGNGAVFVGTKGLMATVNRGEGVHPFAGIEMGGLRTAAAIADVFSGAHAGLGAWL
jgi:hypothetical protein